MEVEKARPIGGQRRGRGDGGEGGQEGRQCAVAFAFVSRLCGRLNTTPRSVGDNCAHRMLKDARRHRS